jgi:hypothetical protein
MRSGNAAAAELVSAKLGPQIGRLHDSRFGVLFCQESARIVLDDLARHITVFVALWSDAIEREVGERRRPIASYRSSFRRLRFSPIRRSSPWAAAPRCS